MAQQFPTGISQPATQFQQTASLRAAGIGIINPVSLQWLFTTSPLNCHYLTPLQTLVTASTVLMFHHPWDAGRASPRFYSCFSGSVVPGRGNSALPFDTYSYSLNPDCRAQCSVQWHVQTKCTGLFRPRFSPLPSNSDITIHPWPGCRFRASRCMRFRQAADRDKAQSII